jgi:hypothetical protein
MTKNQQIRVVKRGRRAGLGEFTETAGAGAVAPPTEREVKAVVAGWVREHRERSEECRRALAAVFAGVQLQTPRSA